MKRKRLGVIIFTLLLIWTGVIFYYSSQPPDISNTQSKTAVSRLSAANKILGFTDTKIYTKIENIIEDRLLSTKQKSKNAVVRKSAHFGMYFLFGIITTCFGYIYSRKLLIALLLGPSLPVMIAVLDEYNQGKIGRTSSLDDVLIDGVGAFCATLIVIFIILLYKILVHINIFERIKAYKSK